jgi:hypothetical protein
LGYSSLRDLNICLIAFWLERYAIDKDKLWKELIDYKYNTNSLNIFQSSLAGALAFFRGFMWAVQAAKWVSFGS